MKTTQKRPHTALRLPCASSPSQVYRWQPFLIPSKRELHSRILQQLKFAGSSYFFHKGFLLSPRSPEPHLHASFFIACSDSTNQLHCSDHFKRTLSLFHIFACTSLAALTTLSFEMRFLTCLNSPAGFQAPCCVRCTRWVLSRHVLNARAMLTGSCSYKLQNKAQTISLRTCFLKVLHDTSTISYSLLICLPLNLSTHRAFGT